MSSGGEGGKGVLRKEGKDALGGEAREGAAPAFMMGGLDFMVSVILWSV